MEYLVYILPALAVMATFFLYPLTVLLVYGLETAADGKASFTAEYYVKVLANPYYYKTIFNSVALCLPTAVFAVFMSLEAAWHIAERKAGSYFLKTVFTFSYAFGGIIYGIIFIFLLGNVGIVPLIEGFITNTGFTAGFAYSPFGLAIAYLLFQIPRSALFLASAFEKMDKDLIPSSRILGANRVQIFLYVFLPLYKKQIISTIMLIFSMSMASYGVAMLVAHSYPIFPLEIYKVFSGDADLHGASAMAVVLFAAVIIVNMVILWSGGFARELYN